MNQDLVKISRFLSLVLRHEPAKIGITLDAQGWVGVDELLAALSRAGKRVTLENLRRVVAENDKKRFSFSEDGERIRANQGHSVEVDLGLEPVEPPEVLYHGTASRFLLSIRREGLTARSRHHVHLSAEQKTAVAVGSRHGVPVVLTVRAARMHADGHLFYRSDNGVWLTDAVAPKYIDFPNG